MSDLLLIAVGALFALLYGLNALLQVIRRTPKVGRFALYLAALALALPLVAWVRQASTDQPEALVQPALLVIAAGLGLFSLIALIGEITRPERLSGSRGVLGLGVALLLALSTFSIPVARQTILAQLPPTPTLPVIALAQVVDGPTSTVTPSRTPFPTFTPSPTRTPRPMTATVNATATPIQFPTRTPVPTATLPTPCVANTQFNVNLRAEPSTEADLVRTIPFGTSVLVYARNEASTWWFTEIDGQRGWLLGEFLVLSPACTSLPAR